jgi:hypothetical protein
MVSIEKKIALVAVELVEVQVESAETPIISITRHQNYKHSKAVHSSRSYLTSIAVESYKIYIHYAPCRKLKTPKEVFEIN